MTQVAEWAGHSLAVLLVGVAVPPVGFEPTLEPFKGKLGEGPLPPLSCEYPLACPR